jgi:hypothetical protein
VRTVTAPSWSSRTPAPVAMTAENIKSGIF